MSRAPVEPILAPVIEVATASRTPDNTPLPGGGAWAWDTAAEAWAETLPDGSPMPAPTPNLEA